ncbi:MAG: response regulator transcription factor [Dehalococcoidia bacterium]|nr:response regulator transcription factor [Dehalococcoidia bacterium]
MPTGAAARLYHFTCLWCGKPATARSFRAIRHPACLLKYRAAIRTAHRRIVAQAKHRRLEAQDKAIASELNLAEVTVKKHVGSIIGKLGVSDRTQAAVVSVRLGLVE